MKAIAALALTLAAIASPAMADSLSVYTQWSSYNLDHSSEASALTYSRDTNSLYVVGDEGGPIVRYSTTGQFLDSFSMLGPTSKPDTEGITYLGNGKFLVADERAQTGYVYTYAAGTTASFSSAHVFGATVGNIGLEGVAYDPATNSVWGVKETAPQAVYKMTNFNQPGQSVIENPGAPGGLHPSRLGLTDLSDIYAMSASLAFVGTDREMNLLILSQEANKIIEMTRDGTKVGTIDISFLGSHSIEGMTMDDLGNIYLSAEDTLAGGGSTLFVLSTASIPEPSTYALMAVGALSLWALSRRKRKVA
jgi:uncharacterized protein YjiK